MTAAPLFGVDAVALDRMADLSAARGEALLARVAGPDDAEVASTLPPGAELAVLFAVKEAVVKAVGGRPEGFRWTDVVTVASATQTSAAVAGAAAVPAEAAEILDALGAQVSAQSRGSLGVRLTGSLQDRLLCGAAQYGVRDGHVLAAVTLWTTDVAEPVPA